MRSRLLLSVFAALVGIGACVLQTETVPGPPGSDGIDGIDGKDGAPGAAAVGACESGAYVTSVDAAGAVVCSPGPDTSIVEAQVTSLQEDLQVVQTQLSGMLTKSTGAASGPTFSFVIPQSGLGGTDRTVLLTIRAAGSGLILARTYLIHTGQNSGVAIGELGVPGTYGTASVSVSENAAFSQFVQDDGLNGVTVSFSQMPSTFSYAYTVFLIGDL